MSIDGNPKVGGSRSFTGAREHEHFKWSCPACGAEHVSPFEAGCPTCGTGTEAQRVQAVAEVRESERLAAAAIPEGAVELIRLLPDRARVTVIAALEFYVSQGAPSPEGLSMATARAWALQLIAMDDAVVE